MRYIIICSLLISCGDVEEHNILSNITISPAMVQCLSMKKLWQVECFCIAKDECEGRRYACFWDISNAGLADNPEMADLYEVFRNDMLACRENSKVIDDINNCEDEALKKALARCEEKLNEKSG